MLELQNIFKEYQAGTTKINALNGIDIAFRESEFVAILGHSGCGKTTLLNIIGGLDQYTSGDLIINGISTKQFSDRDWDAYRNHSVGFVFQSYNLIPHQTVLANVELALTISGVSKAQRRQRAKEALEKVGLGDQMSKKPNQMSGGQMQRVAIARALVNDPDILLADEPTGALDSETSVQVMDILKKIAQEKLVIMVTHNPELAQNYATRIVRMKDGRLTDDSRPYYPDQEPAPAQKKAKRVSMSLGTAFSLSMNNLLTKKGRTFMTAFAGSIGIIGIALILSLSHGINTYINQVQEDTLSSYPITIEAETQDTSSLMSSFMDMHTEAIEEGKGKDPDKVYSNTIMYDMLNAMNTSSTATNNLKKFREFLEKDPGIKEYSSAVQYSYNMNLPLYTTDADGKIMKSDFMELMTSAIGADESQANFMSRYSMLGQIQLMQEMLPGEDSPVSSLLTQQYDLIYGSWPKDYNEVVLIVNSNNEISDMVLYSLGFKNTDSLPEIAKAAMNGETIDDVGQEAWTFQEICDKEFKLVLPSQCWQYNESNGTYTDLSTTETGLEYLMNSQDFGVPLKISGIIRPNEDATASMLTGSIGYTNQLTKYVMEETQNSTIIQKQMEDETTDIFTGLPFATDDMEEPSDEEKAKDFQDYLETLDNSQKAEICSYIMAQPDSAYLDAAVEQAMTGMTREDIETQAESEYAQEMGVDPETVASYIAGLSDEELFDAIEMTIRESAKEQYAQQTAQQLSAMSADQLAGLLDTTPWTQEQYILMYEEFMPPTVSEATLEENYKALGFVESDSPSTINIYASTFSDKDEISAIIGDYNEKAAEEDQILYTDYVALLMSSITDIISGISYVLIAFVAISLVVSSIMIGIITYISVLERTREIGILRSIGASKRDISHVFNAETLLVGLTAGLIGIGVSVLINIPITAIIHNLTDIQNLSASLPWQGGLILVAISMILTFIAGLIPSSVAAKKDPVVALRTE